MKRVGFLYEKICDIDNIYKAIDKVTEGRRNLKPCQRLLKRKEHYAYYLQRRLLEGNYILGKSGHFMLTQKNGKIREISVPRLFPDQVVHWAVCLVLKDLFMKGMYSHNVGSIEGRGGIAGKKYIDKIYAKDKTIKYCMKLDIKKFYPSIKHDKLKELFRKKIKDEQTLKLIDAIIDSDGDEGLPIGFYSSQWFANFYLQEIDHFIKEQLHIKYYVRYIDDMVMFDTNKRKLHKAKCALDKFLLDNNYGITIKENWQIWKIHSRPLDFLGYKFYKNKTLLRKTLFLSIMRSVNKIKKKGYCTIKRARSLSSLLGWLNHIPAGRDCYVNLIKPIISKKRLAAIVSIVDKKINIKKMRYEYGSTI